MSCPRGRVVNLLNKFVYIEKKLYFCRRVVKMTSKLKKI